MKHRDEPVFLESVRQSISHKAARAFAAVKFVFWIRFVTVTGKAYWDVGHAPKDQSNRRSHLPGYTAWEIHPVMKLEVQ